MLFFKLLSFLIEPLSCPPIPIQQVIVVVNYLTELEEKEKRREGENVSMSAADVRIASDPEWRPGSLND